MKKSLITLSAIALLTSGVSFAGTNSNNAPKPPQHDSKFHQAMTECMSSAGVQKPSEPPKQNGTPSNNAQNGDRPAPPPSDANGQNRPQPPKDNMTDAQRQKVDSCMSAKGFERPKDMPNDGNHNNRPQPKSTAQ